MPECITLIETYQFLPHILDENLGDTVSEAVHKNMEKCTEKGYILNVKNVEIEDASISPSCSMLDITVKILCTRLLPRPGDIYVGKICLIFEVGILFQVAQVLKVLVPLEDGKFINLTGTWNAEKNYDSDEEYGEKVMVNSKGDTFFLGDLKRIKIENAHYNPMNKGFNCYASFVKDEK